VITENIIFRKQDHTNREVFIFEFPFAPKHNSVENHPMSIHVQFGFSRLTVFKMVVAILDF
jgi:hypothetical protein